MDTRTAAAEDRVEVHMGSTENSVSVQEVGSPLKRLLVLICTSA